MNLSRAVALFGLLAALSGNLYAHHGWGGFNEDFNVQATVVSLRFLPPHDEIVVEDTEGNSWRLTLAPSSRNRQFGYTSESIDVGQSVRIVGQKDPRKFEGKVHFINDVVTDENIYTYYYGTPSRPVTSWDRRR